jgi:hypothetical protein
MLRYWSHKIVGVSFTTAFATKRPWSTLHPLANLHRCRFDHFLQAAGAQDPYRFLINAPFNRDRNRSENLDVMASEGSRSMPQRKRRTVEQIIAKLREAEVELFRW